MAGLVIGAALATWWPAASRAVLPVAATTGGLWLQALQMPLIPLVFALIVTGVGATLSAAGSGSLAVRLLVLFAVLLVCAAIFSALFTTGVLALSPIPDSVLAGVRAAIGAAASHSEPPPSLGDWVAMIVPANPIAAAANGQMMQIVLFALVFALALNRIECEPRERVFGAFRALGSALQIIIGWALFVAPLGVFALAFAVASRAGFSVAATLAHYAAVMVGNCLAILIFAYALAVIGGRIPLRRFARAALAPQAVAASTQSSLASLPAMVEAMQDDLQVSRDISGVVLSIAVAVFRITSPSINLAVAIYCGHLFGVPLSSATLAAGIAVACMMTLASTGLPGQSNFLVTIVPICAVMRVPITALPLLMAIEVIPDIFRTIVAVTADMAVAATVAARWRHKEALSASGVNEDQGAERPNRSAVVTDR